MKIRATRPLRFAALACAASLALGACSTANDGEAPADGSNSSAASEETNGTADETRTVTDSEGNEVVVSADPQKVVTLHFAATQALLDLGITPVLQGSGNLETQLPDEKYELVKDVPQLQLGELDVEQVAAEEPDLILIPNMVDAEVIEQLKDVAPSYIYTHGGEERANWQGRVAQIADATNRTANIDELEQQLTERQAELAEKAADTIADLRVAHIAAYGDQALFGAHGVDSMPGRILHPAGVQWADQIQEAVKDADGEEQSLSTEQITSTLSDADVILYTTDHLGATNAELDAVMESTAFQALPAVQEGRVYPIGKSTIASYSDAYNVLDFLDQALDQLNA